MLSTYKIWQNGFIENNLLISLNNEILNLDEQQDEIDNCDELFDDFDFDYDVFINLKTAGEKIRYTSEYCKISDDVIDKLKIDINDLLNDSINEDLESTLKAIIILYQYDIKFIFPDEMIKTIINSMFFEKTAKNSVFIIIKYLIVNKIQLPIDMFYDLIKESFDDEVKTRPYIFKFISKYILYFDVQIPYEKYIIIFNNLAFFNFKEKKNAIKLFCAMILTKHDILPVFQEYIDQLLDILYDLVDIEPFLSLFVTFNLYDNSLISDDFISIILENFNSLNNNN